VRAEAKASAADTCLLPSKVLMRTLGPVGVHSLAVGLRRIGDRTQPFLGRGDAGVRSLALAS
jgi:hypothetical protein